MVVKLPYSLHGRYKSIAIAWTIITIPPTLLNLGLIYGLWYGTNIDRALVLTIPTSLLGIGTAISIIARLVKLCAGSAEYRPLNSSRYALDPFMWGYFLALIMISSEISCALSLPNGPHLTLIAMPVPSLMLLLATLLLISLALNMLEVKAPFRLGSTGRGGAEVRSAIFYVVEDVVAVDGNGGRVYRTAFNESVAWIIVFYVAGAALITMIWVLSRKGQDAQMVALGISWAGPFALGGLLAWGTIVYVQACLRREGKKESADEDGERRPLLGT